LAYRVIAGEFHIRYPDMPRQGPEPDGDTLKFKPDNPTLVDSVQRNGGRGPDFNGKGMVNIRFEGIDALETHFEQAHQELQGANDARDFVLAEVGFQNVQFFADLPNKVSDSDEPSKRGYVLANGIDPHGRAIAFVYAGEPPGDMPNGSAVMLMPAMANQSINARLLAAGLAYPAFYTSLPIDLMDGLAGIVDQARQAGLGLWPRQQGTPQTPALLRNLADAEAMVIWPKLFRRLVSYFGEGHVGLADFENWLRSDPVNRDDSIILPDRELGNMHDVLAIDPIADTLFMRFAPELLIIVPDGVLPNLPPRKIPPAVVGGVRIVAALANPTGVDRVAGETLTLLNVSPDDVTLDGWYLIDLANRRHNLAGNLVAGEALRVRLANLQLNNTGDSVMLRDAADSEIDSVSYTAQAAAREGWTIVF
jgi:Lamin Tail Domain/Staphylococcal nuclease homologue